jgi:hypothetical protein
LLLWRTFRVRFRSLIAHRSLFPALAFPASLFPDL